MKAVILAGGFGKRLRPLTDTTPKPLIPVGGKPIIEWQINWLRQYGYDSFVIAASYLSEKIIEFLDHGKKFGVETEVVVEKEPLGTGGALKNVQHLLNGEKEFLMVNGDNITNLKVSEIKLGKHAAALALTPLRSPYGIINVQGGEITNFVEKPLLDDYWINSGVYKLTPQVFEFLPKNGSIETETFPELVKRKQIGGTKFADCYWHGSDTIKDVEEINKDFSTRRIF